MVVLIPQQYLMATQEDLVNIIATFSQNYPEDGFIAFDSKAAINYIGNVLINYKGLRLIRFRKSQLMPAQFLQADFATLCDQVLTQPSKQGQLFQILKQEYPQCSICIVQGGIYRPVGQLAAFCKGQVMVLVY